MSNLNMSKALPARIDPCYHCIYISLMGSLGRGGGGGSFMSDGFGLISGLRGLRRKEAEGKQSGDETKRTIPPEAQFELK